MTFRAMLVLLLCALGGCAGDDGDASLDAAAVVPQPPHDAAAPPRDGGGACSFTGEREHAHDSAPAMHVAQALDPSGYNSDPPSSGPHCGAWGWYASYRADAPLPACHFLHNLEHGAVALLYNCPGGCPELLAELQTVMSDPPSDPDCGDPRLLLTPYSDMSATVAAAAWGYTWTADCLDAAAVASLRAFVEDHIGSRGDAPEPTVCQDGAIAP